MDYYIFNQESESKYTQISEEEYIQIRKLDGERKFINLGYAVLEVDRYEYIQFYKEKRRQKYLLEEAILHREFHYHTLDNGEELIVDASREPIDKAVIDKIFSKDSLEKLNEALKCLPEEELNFILRIYKGKQSERDLSVVFGISQPAIHKRKTRILKKIKIFLEK